MEKLCTRSRVMLDSSGTGCYIATHGVRNMNRREFTADATFALSALVVGAGSAARERHRRAIVLDCNLSPPAGYDATLPGWDPEQVTAETVEAVRRSGL